MDKNDKAAYGNVGSYGRPSLLECRANLNLNEECNKSSDTDHKPDNLSKGPNSKGNPRQQGWFCMRYNLMQLSRIKYERRNQTQ